MKKASLLGFFIALLFTCSLVVKPTNALEKYFYIDASAQGFNRILYTRETNPIDPNSPPPGKTFQSLMRDYDTLLFYVSVQGTVNRAKPTFTVSTDPIDTRWLDKLAQADVWLQNSSRVSLSDITAVINEFKKPQYGIKGSVVWTEDKPYTQNIAATVAGADNLVIVRRGSPLFDQITAAFPIRADFSNEGMGAQFNSKRQGYQWAIDNYLKTGKSKPILAYQKDGYLLKLYKEGKMFLHPQHWGMRLGWGVMTYDVMMANQTFFIDVSPRVETQPADEPNQPQGEDKGTFDMAIAAARERLGNDAVMEFWGYPNEKYFICDHGINGVFCGEWPFAEVVSRAGGMKRYGGGEQWGYETANYSFYQHGPGVDMVSQPASMTQRELLRRGYAAGYPDNFSFEEGENRWNMDSLTNHVVYNPSNGGIAPAHGNNYLEVNLNQADRNNPQKTHSFFQDVGINMMRAYRYKYSIKTRTPTGAEIKGTQTVWGFGPGGADILCEKPFTTTSQAWVELSCEFDVKADGYSVVRLEVYLDTVDVNYSFDEAFFEGPNTTRVNPNKKFLTMYLGDYDMANSLYVQPMVTDTGHEEGRDVGLPLDDNMVANFPVGWGIAADFAREVPPLFAYRAKKKTNTDWFVMPDSGAGYNNPGKFRHESAQAWINDTTNQHRKYGYRSGWALEGFHSETLYCFTGQTHWDNIPVSCDVGKGQFARNMFKTIAPEGIFYSGLQVESFLDDRLAGVQLGGYAWAGLSTPMAAGLQLWSKVAPNDKFIALRNVYVAPRIIRDSFNASRAAQDPSIEAVDPNTLFNLFKASKGMEVANRSTLVSHNVPGVMVKGQQYNVSITLRNDGWDTWVPTTENCGGFNPPSKGCHVYAAGWLPGANPDVRTKLTSEVWLGISNKVEPGQVYTFNFTMTAPSEKGKYTFKSNMVKDQMTSFEAYGDVPWQKVVRVLDAPLDRNTDGKVTYEDAESLLNSYGTADASKDINGDGKVNAFDIGLINNNAELPVSEHL